MEEKPIFIAPTAKPGEVRLYGNRIEIDRRGLIGTYTRTVYLWNVAFLGYSGGKGLDIVAPNHTSTGLELKRKDDARAFVDRLNELIGR